MGQLSKLVADVGRMDQLVSIRQYTETTDATGGISETPTYLAQDIWAQIDYTSQSDEGDRGEDQQVVAYRRLKFTFRNFYPTISEKMRIVYETYEYDILNIAKLGRDRFLVIEAEKRDNET